MEAGWRESLLLRLRWALQLWDFARVSEFLCASVSSPAGGDGLVAKACPTLATPWTIACQAPLSMVFSGQ